MASSPFCDYHWVQGSPLPRKCETHGGFHIQSSDLPFPLPAVLPPSFALRSARLEEVYRDATLHRDGQGHCDSGSCAQWRAADGARGSVGGLVHGAGLPPIPISSTPDRPNKSAAKVRSRARPTAAAPGPTSLPRSRAKKKSGRLQRRPPSRIEFHRHLARAPVPQRRSRTHLQGVRRLPENPRTRPLDVSAAAAYSARALDRFRSA